MNQRAEKIVENAQELLKAYGYFIDNLWHVDDVHFICEQKNLPALSNKEAMEVFTIANEQFDGETGLCWPQLEKALHAYLRRKSIFESIFRKDCA